MNAPTAISLITSYDGRTPARNWIRDARGLFDAVPAGSRKIVLRSKLLGAAKAHLNTLPDIATVDEVLDSLERVFPEEKLATTEILKLKQEEGENVQEYANRLSIAIGKVNNTDVVISAPMARTLFIEGLLPHTKHTVLVMQSPQMSLQDLIQLAKNVENANATTNKSTSSNNKISDLLFIDQRLQQVEHEIKSTARNKRKFENDLNPRKFNADSKSSCDKCNKMGHTAMNCRSHIRCYNCGRNGHYQSDCRAPRQTKRRMINVLETPTSPFSSFLTDSKGQHTTRAASVVDPMSPLSSVYTVAPTVTSPSMFYSPLNVQQLPVAPTQFYSSTPSIPASSASSSSALVSSGPGSAPASILPPISIYLQPPIANNNNNQRINSSANPNQIAIMNSQDA